MSVPVWFPEDYQGFSSEDSLLYNVVDLCLGLWPNEYVVSPEDLISPNSTILHEYAHRARRKGLIDMVCFQKPYCELRNDPRCIGVVKWVEKASRTNTLEKSVGWGRDNERSAYLAELIAMSPCGFKMNMHELYRHFFRAPEHITNTQIQSR
jgi:hypothetical protein